MLWGAPLIFGLAVVVITFTMTLINLRLYRRPAAPAPADPTPVAVCVPARNEEANIEPCVRSLLASTHPSVRVFVYDDQSTDATATIIARLTSQDPRAIAVPARPLPEGWNGKQHACWRCAELAIEHHAAWLLFTDADVRFEPGAISAALDHAHRSGSALVSTFPRQVTGSWAEHAVVPMIFFILFGYLPMPRMRRSLDPSASAGCGQFLFARADAYTASGGHAAFRASMHDGIMMPRAFRRAGFRTDLFDATSLCSVRMYRGLAQTWRGFAKNAYEGLGSIALLVFLTVAHACGHVLPWAYLAAAMLGAADNRWTPLAIAALALTLLQRSLLATAFRHDWRTVILHPVGIVMMTMIQWHSLWLSLSGRRTWRGRTQRLPTTG